MLGFDLNSAVSLQRFETQFQDLGKIGAGGFSIVNKVKNTRDNKTYALKTITIKPSELKGQAADYLQKTLVESKILSDLSHPNILQYFGCWVNAMLKTEKDLAEQNEQNEVHEEQLELVMEQYDQNSCGFQFEKRSSDPKKKQQNKNKITVYHQIANDNIFGADFNKFKEIKVYVLSQLGEMSLQKYIWRRSQQSRKTYKQRKSMIIENYRMILDIIQGLMYLHNQKIIHRDIKLQNIIIDKNKRCKIIDFGLAKKVRNLKSLKIQKFEHEKAKSDDIDTEERHSSSVGTKIFSSPEQTNSDNYDHRTDIYSLAMVIGVIFSQYTTAHEEGLILLNLRNKKFDQLNIDERLKILLLKCLSQQKLRPDLTQLKSCIKMLLKQSLQNKQNQQQHRQQNASPRQKIQIKQGNNKKQQKQQKVRQKRSIQLQLQQNKS